MRSIRKRQAICRFFIDSAVSLLALPFPYWTYRFSIDRRPEFKRLLEDCEAGKQSAQGRQGEIPDNNTSTHFRFEA